jgi:hypothetical protein
MSPYSLAQCESKHLGAYGTAEHQRHEKEKMGQTKLQLAENAIGSRLVNPLHRGRPPEEGVVCMVCQDLCEFVHPKRRGNDGGALLNRRVAMSNGIGMPQRGSVPV